MRFPDWVRLNIAEETLKIDKEYFRERFEKVLEEFFGSKDDEKAKEWMLNELMKCFDDDYEEGK